MLSQDISLDLLGFNLCTVALDISVTTRRRRKLKAAVAEALARPARVRVRLLCSVCGQIQSIQLAYGIKCRIRSRYLLLAVRLALAGNPDYGAYMAPGARALEELALWGADVDTSARQPMHVHLHRPDFIIECDASDSALAGIVVRTPTAPWRVADSGDVSTRERRRGPRACGVAASPLEHKGGGGHTNPKQAPAAAPLRGHVSLKSRHTALASK